MTETHPQNHRLGYARVSTYGQTLDAQLEQLRGVGCTKIFREKMTGAQSYRRQLLKMLDTLAPGDVVTVTRIERLARSTFDLFAIVKQSVDAQAQFRPLAEPWADTGTSTGRLMIAVLGGLADVERDLIRTRTAEGRSRAQKRGSHRRPSAKAHGRRPGRRARIAGQSRYRRHANRAPLGCLSGNALSLYSRCANRESSRRLKNGGSTISQRGRFPLSRLFTQQSGPRSCVDQEFQAWLNTRIQFPPRILAMSAEE